MAVVAEFFVDKIAEFGFWRRHRGPIRGGSGSWERGSVFDNKKCRLFQVKAWSVWWLLYEEGDDGGF